MYNVVEKSNKKISQAAFYIACGILLLFPFSVLFYARLQVIACLVGFLLVFSFALTKRQFLLKRQVLSLKWFVLLSLVHFVSMESFVVTEVASIVRPLLFVLIACSVFTYESDSNIDYFGLLTSALFIAVLLASLWVIFSIGSLRAFNANDKILAGSFSNAVVGPCVLAACYANYKVLVSSSRREFYYFMYIVSGVLLILSQSRIGLGLFGLVILYTVWSHSRGEAASRILKFIFWLILLSILSVIGYALFFSSIGGILESTVTRILQSNQGFNVDYYLGDDRTGLSVRTIQFYVALEVIKQNIWFGIGFGEFPNFMESLYGFRVTVHNMLMKSWVAVGIIGPILLVAMCVSVFARLLRTYREFLLRGDSSQAKFSQMIMVVFSLLLIQSMFKGIVGDYVFLLVLAFASSKHCEWDRSK